MNLPKASGASSGVIEHLLLVALLAIISVLFVHNEVLWRWDNLLYDAQLSFWTRSVPDDIIIVAIDDESLYEIGRWPWPRSIHAELINRLKPENPRAIGLDIIISEPDSNDPLSDVLLARAIRASGNVVLPVYMSQESSNSYPIEALPLPDFADHAEALGHVHVDISDDGIARMVYLREGIGDPRWPHYSLALLGITGEVDSRQVDVSAPARTEQYSSMHWYREDPYLVPFAGPPGHFTQIGYSQVLAGEYSKDLFRDKIVLIGSTAEGLGDALPTPLSGDGGPMPGVEIIANVIDAVRNDLRITEMRMPWLAIITALLACLPLLIYPFINPAKTLLMLFGAVAGTLGSVALLLWLFGLWVPVSTVLLFQVVSYPLWSWRRLVLAMHHINGEIDQLSERRRALSMHRDRNIRDEIMFVSQFVPVSGWVLQDKDGHNLSCGGTPPSANLAAIDVTGWTLDGYSYWAPLHYQNQTCRLGLNIGPDAVITDVEMRLLDSLIATPPSVVADESVMAEDVLQARINQVQAAGRDYEELRKVIDDSLSGMADGVLICNSRGQVMLSNHRAGWYLYGDDDARINGKSLTDIISLISVKAGDNWKPMLQKVLLEQGRVNTEAQHEEGRDLMVEISPLRYGSEDLGGLIVNLSDISMLKASERKRNETLDFLSHDLRSPLSSMIAMIELAKNKASADDVRSMLVDMERNTEKTLHLAEQFLQLSRAKTTENISFYDIDFNSVVLNAMDRLWALSRKTGVSVEHEFDREELWTHAEPDLLERAIINLLSNAIKHSKPGGTVGVVVKVIDDEIICCINDHGSGVAVEDMPHLFEMFRRTRGAGVERKQGIGLGLAFVDAVARRHAGRVDVESKLGEGSSFCLRIPRAETIDPDESSD